MLSRTWTRWLSSGRQMLHVAVTTPWPTVASKVIGDMLFVAFAAFEEDDLVRRRYFW